MIRVRKLGNKSLDMKAPGRRQQAKVAPAGLKELELSKGGGLFAFLFHLVACCASMYIGHQLFKETGFVLQRSGSVQEAVDFSHRPEPLNGADLNVFPGASSSQVYRDFLFYQEMKDKQNRHNRISEIKSNSTRVGRHGILIRDYPHPDPLKVMLASELLDLLQEEQYGRFTPGPFRPIIVITPTYSRTFQRVHMIHLVNSLKLARAQLFWIVVEAQGKSNDTREILSASGLDFVHLQADVKVPFGWQERELAEVHLREVGLRYVRATRMDGLVVFADDSSVLSRSFFDEVQKVEWVGAMSVGMSIHELFSQTSERTKASSTVNGQHRRKLLEEKQLRVPVQGPVCDQNKTLIGWHTYPHYPQDFIEGLPEYSLPEDQWKHAPKERAPMAWLSFVLNSRLLWDHPEVFSGLPRWIRPFREWMGDGEVKFRPGSMNVGRADLLKRLISDESKVEPLGKCGTAVMAWWLKADARSDSKYPAGWRLHDIEIVVPAKSTPWPKSKKNTTTTSLVSSAGGEIEAEQQGESAGEEQPEFHDSKEAEEEESSIKNGEEKKKLRKGQNEQKWEKKSKADKVSKAREALGSLGEFAEKQKKSMEEEGGKH